MRMETITGQIVSKANHYQTSPNKDGGRRIFKDGVIRAYERNFINQCQIYKGMMIDEPFRLLYHVYNTSYRYDIDGAAKTLLDCLEMVRGIKNDNLCVELVAHKHIDIRHPRIIFGIEEINEHRRLF